MRSKATAFPTLGMCWRRIKLESWALARANMSGEVTETQLQSKTEYSTIGSAGVSLSGWAAGALMINGKATVESSDSQSKLTAQLSTEINAGIDPKIGPTNQFQLRPFINQAALQVMGGSKIDADWAAAVSVLLKHRQNERYILILSADQVYSQIPQRSILLLD